MRVQQQLSAGLSYRDAVRAAIARDEEEVEVPLVLLAERQPQRMAVAAA